MHVFYARQTDRRLTSKEKRLNGFGIKRLRPASISIDSFPARGGFFTFRAARCCAVRVAILAASAQPHVMMTVLEIIGRNNRTYRKQTWSLFALAVKSSHSGLVFCK